MSTGDGSSSGSSSDDDEPAPARVVKLKPVRSPPACAHAALPPFLPHASTRDESVITDSTSTAANDELACQVCLDTTAGERMLLCDGCEKGFHIFCVEPKLNAVPTGDWFCTRCAPNSSVSERPCTTPVIRPATPHGAATPEGTPSGLPLVVFVPGPRTGKPARSVERAANGAHPTERRERKKRGTAVAALTVGGLGLYTALSDDTLHILELPRPFTASSAALFQWREVGDAVGVVDMASLSPEVASPASGTPEGLLFALDRQGDIWRMDLGAIGRPVWNPWYYQMEIEGHGIVRAIATTAARKETDDRQARPAKLFAVTSSHSLFETDLLEVPLHLKQLWQPVSGFHQTRDGADSEATQPASAEAIAGYGCSLLVACTDGSCHTIGDDDSLGGRVVLDSSTTRLAPLPELLRGSWPTLAVEGCPGGDLVVFAAAGAGSEQPTARLFWSSGSSKGDWIQQPFSNSKQPSRKSKPKKRGGEQSPRLAKRAKVASNQSEPIDLLPQDSFKAVGHEWIGQKIRRMWELDSFTVPGLKNQIRDGRVSQWSDPRWWRSQDPTDTILWKISYADPTSEEPIVEDLEAAEVLDAMECATVEGRAKLDKLRCDLMELDAAVWTRQQDFIKSQKFFEQDRWGLHMAVPANNVGKMTD
jgi:hypothetical protein